MDKCLTIVLIIFIFIITARRARVFYEPNVKTNLCDICNGEDCGDICVGEPGKQNNNKNQSSSLTSNIYAIISFTIILSFLQKYI